MHEDTEHPEILVRMTRQEACLTAALLGQGHCSRSDGMALRLFRRIVTHLPGRTFNMAYIEVRNRLSFDASGFYISEPTTRLKDLTFGDKFTVETSHSVYMKTDEHGDDGRNRCVVLQGNLVGLQVYFEPSTAVTRYVGST